MTEFWTIVSFMLVLAVLLVAPALLRQRKRVSINRKQQNIEIARERMRELDAEHARGELSKEDYDFSREEIEQSLLDDVSGETDEINDEDAVVRGSATFGRATLIAIVVALPLGALSLYHSLGTPMAISMPEMQASAQQNSAGSTVGPGGMTMQDAALKLAARLKQEPNNAEGWFLLGQTYMAMNQYKEASDAFSRSYKLKSDNPKVMLRYADAMAMARGGRIQGEPFEIIKKALKLAPNDVTALWLAGIGHAEIGEYRKAIDYWRRAEPMVASQQPASLKDLQSMIANAEQALGVPASQRSKPMQAAAANHGIQVEVSLDPKVAQQAQPGDTVFVYAKAASGPPMPLAVARKQVRDLPFTVTLDDSMALMPQMKLSNFPQVSIGARISKSGNATPQDGDLESDTQSVKSTTSKTIKIQITHQRGMPAPVAAATPAAKGNNGIRVEVSLDPKVAQQAKPDDTVFVYAKAASGPPMPLAVARKKVSDLPLTVTLSDDMAMMPQMKLSNFDQVRVGARISSTGNAMPQSGDLEGDTKRVKVTGADTVRILIKHKRP